LTVVDPLRSGLLWASENAVLREHLPNFRFVRATVDRFMPGEGAEDALAAAQRLMEADGIPATFTRLGENVRELSQAADAAGDYLRTLDRIAELGLDAEISVKLTQLGFDLDPNVTATHVQRLVDRSAELGRTCWIDMESTHYVAGTVDLYEKELARSPSVGLCLQAYLRRTYDDVQRLLPARPSIRLVKGAYREPKDVAFQSKPAIDESYFRLANHLVSGGARRVTLGSHDTDLIARIEAALGGHDGFEIAMLYGIRSDEQRRLRAEGYDVRTLISYGPSWYPWFMRRIAEKPVENTLLALRNLV
jgi:proline dehydrogenase